MSDVWESHKDMAIRSEQSMNMTLIFVLISVLASVVSRPAITYSEYILSALRTACANQIYTKHNASRTLMSQ